jgi:hypothetical protein
MQDKGKPSPDPRAFWQAAVAQLLASREELVNELERKLEELDALDTLLELLEDLAKPPE